MQKVWEGWQQDLTPDHATHPETGEHLEIWTDYDGMKDTIFTFYETVKVVNTGETLVHTKMQLKFRTMEEILNSLKEVGFSKVQVFGDWKHQLADDRSHSLVFHAFKYQR